jgi:uncharacterized protein YjbI with pentapeptide repeats
VYEFRRPRVIGMTPRCGVLSRRGVPRLGDRKEAAESNGVVLTFRARLAAVRAAWRVDVPTAPPAALSGRVPHVRRLGATAPPRVPARRLSASRAASARVELATSGPIELKPDRWQMATAIASLLSVLAVGVGLIVTNNYNRKQQQLGVEQQQLSRQGQITDRFTKAVEQLGQSGSQKIDVRLGAIYALQRIMRDSRSDQPAVVDILSAFIRVHAPASRRAPGKLFSAKPAPPPVDIQAALTVLARRNPDLDGEGRVDLSQADLSQAALSGADLEGADLAGADLRGAVLRGAVLRGANLGHTGLSRADLEGADLEGAYLVNADLRRVYLMSADLRRVNLISVNLVGAYLLDADLSHADLSDANLRGADLTGVVLSGAVLRGADLRTVTLGDTDSVDVDLTNKILQCPYIAGPCG